MSGKKHPDGNNQSRSLMKQEQITGIQATAISYSSPIPPPEIISQYELIIPEAANRILTAFLKQSNHRQKIEKDVIYGDNIRSFLGLLCGFAIALGALFTTIYISSISAPFSAAIFGSTGMAGLVGVFIYGKNAQVQNLNKKMKILNQQILIQITFRIKKILNCQSVTTKRIKRKPRDLKTRSAEVSCRNVD